MFREFVRYICYRSLIVKLPASSHLVSNPTYLNEISELWILTSYSSLHVITVGQGMSLGRDP